MKYLIIIAAFTFTTSSVVAQQTTGNTTGTVDTARAKAASNARAANPIPNKLPKGTAVRGGKVVPLHHGDRDYTPGSPIGTGGSGGGNMSGSTQGSALKNALGEVPADELLEEDPKLVDSVSATKAKGSRMKSGGTGTRKTTNATKNRQGSNRRP